MSTETIRPLRVTNLRCEFTVEPLGVDQAAPRLNWAVESARCGAVPAGFEILVATSAALLADDVGDLWSPGRQAADDPLAVIYGGRALASGERACWKVRVWTHSGEVSDWSRLATWEMGLLSPEDWQARWIGAPWHSQESGGGPAPHFRTRFQLPAAIRAARAYVCGLGYFELRVNGRKVGDDVLVPNQTDYSERPNLWNRHFDYADKAGHRVLYLTYDLAGHLAAGENVVGVILGNGWYHHSRTAEGRHGYGSPRLLCQLHVDLADGSRQVIASGPDWQVTTGPIVRDDLYAGEFYDARRELPGWDTPGDEPSPPLAVGSSWQAARLAEPPTGVLQAQMSPPDRVMQTLRPVAIRTLDAAAGEYLVDFGQALAGWVRLRVRGPTGTRIIMRFADDLVDGQPGPQTGSGEYVLKGGGAEVYEPRFSWYGFRTMTISGWPGGPPRAEDVEARVVHAAVETVGEFGSSHELLNRAHKMFLWSQRSNMHGGVASDCPHRERLGYTGDGQVAAEAAMHSFDMASFYTKWLTDMLNAQDPDDGYVPHTVPFQGGGGGAAWGAACCIMPWMHYVHYGDPRILERHHESMKRWVGYLGGWARDGIVVKERPGAWVNLGEWCAPGESPPVALVDTHLYARCAHIVARSADVLGLGEDRAAYLTLYERIREAFHARFYRPGESWYGPAGATALALAIDAPPVALRPAVVEAMAGGILRGADGHLDTGIIGTPWLFEMLCREGRADVAMTMMTQTSAPGYGWWLAQGATTTWEWWNGNGSHNHPMFGGGLTWLYRHLAGVQADPDEPAYRHVIVRPCPVDGVSWASYAVATHRGRVAAEWRMSTERFHLAVAVPFGSRGTVHLPVAGAVDVRDVATGDGCADSVVAVPGEAGRTTFAIGAGRYEFTVVRAPAT